MGWVQNRPTNPSLKNFQQVKRLALKVKGRPIWLANPLNFCYLELAIEYQVWMSYFELEEFQLTKGPATHQYHFFGSE